MPEDQIKPVGKLTPVNPNETDIKPVGKLTPVGSADQFVPPIQNFDPTPKQKGDVEATLNDIVKTSKGTILDHEKDALRDLLNNPNTTPEQAKETISTIQGYHPKFKDSDRSSYYMKRDDNGVLVAKPLAYGEKPPKGYNVASVWGNDAKNDSWYTDLGKSLYNGVVGVPKGIVDIAQLGTMLATGKESKTLNSTSNVLESLQFEKDPALNESIYNTEGIEKWGDLVDKNRFNFSGNALWGTLNSVAESASSFLLGAGVAAKTAQGLTGVSKLSQLSNGAKSAAAFTGSFLQQVGDNLDDSKEAGLTGRDAATVALGKTAVQAGIDASFGIDAAAFKKLLGKTDKELFKNIVRTVEKDAEGKVTEEGFKQLAKDYAGSYDNLIKTGIKQYGKDVLKEGAQEASQDFVAKSAEQLWDKLSDEDKAKFGTDALDAKSFGSYAQNMFAGLVGGAAFGVANNNAKKQYNDQSVDAIKIVEGGKDKMDEFKANLYQATRNGDITPEERDRAIFKVDTYNKYNEQMQDFPNMSKEDKKNAFELSFNIEALKNETKFSPEELEKLDPLAIAKIDNKKTLIKGLQKELNHLLLRQDIQKETKVGQDTVNKVVKDEGLEKEEGKEITVKELINKLGGLKSTPATEVTFEEGKPEPAPRQKISDLSTPEWNKLAVSNPLKVKQIVQEHLKTTPNNEMPVIIRSGKNGVLTADIGENKQIRFAQSRKSTDPNKPNFFKYENLPATQVDYTGNVADRGGDADMSNEAEHEFYYKDPATLKRVEFDSKNKEGEPMKKAVLAVYNPQNGKFIGFLREHSKGKSNYTSESDQKHLQNIINSNFNTEEISQYKRPESEQQLTPEDQNLQDISEYETRPLSTPEIQHELEKESAREQAFAETGQFQKQSVKSKDYQKVLERMQKNFPKVKIVLDNTIKGAGQVQGNTIKINPDYAGTDTPIHEGGHILIDAIGYNNKVIQSAIKQLKDTDLWKETKERYLELNEEMLGKEVLAEAIGRNGADIFDTEAQKSRFMAFLDYIFNKLKQLLGLDKNVARSLAKQVIGGIGTKNLTGKSEQVQEQREAYNREEINALIDEIKSTDNVEALQELYNDVIASDINGKTKILNELMQQIALTIKRNSLRESGKELDDEEAARDITWPDKWFKVLSHFTDVFPEMKAFSKMWNSAFFAKMKQVKEERKTHDKLATDVIREKSKTVDLKGKALQALIGKHGDKYFGYLDKSGRLITLEEAQKEGLSKAQIDYLKFVREKLSENPVEGEDIYNADMDVLKLDKGFNEAYRTSGMVSAVATWLGANNLSNVKLYFTDPQTKKTSKMDFIDIQNRLSEYAKEGHQADALFQLFKYTLKAKKNRKTKGGEYFLDENGKLNNRFNQPRDERKEYSKNFYNAMNAYIDETAHIKHISPLVPIINSIEYLNSQKKILDGEGNVLHEEKKNLVEWIKKWNKLHILRQDEPIQPEIDKALKLLRFMTSAMTMWFNVPANAINVALGNYNNWRQENSETWAKGQKRLFGGKKRGGWGTVNKYALDIIKKYSAVSADSDSNPMQGANNWFTKLAYAGQNLGELQIQGSGLLGLMSEEDYNSFEYKPNKYGVEELVVKDGVDEKALEDRILSHIDKVSDVQGKYGEKDRRNIMNNELGRALMSYKVWMPDALRIRYGEQGSWRTMFRNGFEELRNDIKEKGKVKAFWENKAFMSNLKGLMVTGFLMSLVMQDDDDEEKSYAAKMFQRALSDVMFIFEPDNLKFTLKRPIAAIGTIEKLIDLGDHMVALGEDDFLKSSGKYGDKGDSKVPKDIVGLLPKPAKFAVDELLDEE